MASPLPSSQDTDPYADRRLYPRVEVALPAFLEVEGERHSVRLLDVSPGGAKVSCAIGVALGTPVTLDCGTLGRSAVVRWQNGDLFGLCFDSELDARDVSALIDRSKALAERIAPKG
jgi:hypothetical protein